MENLVSINQITSKVNSDDKNEFIESGLENWVSINQITSKVNSDDKKMNID